MAKVNQGAERQEAAEHRRMSVQHRAGRLAVITGGASGIGRALARRFSDEDMKVAVFDINDERLAGISAELGGSSAFKVDVSQPESVESAARRCIAHFGAPAVLCANAGIAGPTGRRLWSIPLSEWQHTLGVNLIGVINCLRSFLPSMLEAGGGHIVITASMAAVTARASTPVYVVSKHAVLAVAESLRLQIRREGIPIGVSVLLPASVSTNFAESHDSEFGPEDRVPDASPAIDPDVVASQVVDAIDHNRFYAFTHADSKHRLDAWYAEIIAAYDVFGS